MAIPVTPKDNNIVLIKEENANMALKIDTNEKLQWESIFGQYENPLLSLCRELICNALDSTVISKSKSSVEVIINHDNNTLFITDNGLGMSYDDIINIYSYAYKSTKTKTNKAIGEFGIGKLSPLAYTNKINVRTIKDKQLIEFEIEKDYPPKLNILYKENNVKLPNSTTVYISYKEEDKLLLDTYVNYIALPLNKIIVKRIIENNVITTIENNDQYVYNKNFVFNTNIERLNILYMELLDKLKCIHGYHLNIKTINIKDKLYTNTLNINIKGIRYLVNFTDFELDDISINCNFDLYFEEGILEKNQTREIILITDNNTKAIKEKYKLFLLDMYKYLIEYKNKYIEKKDYNINIEDALVDNLLLKVEINNNIVDLSTNYYYGYKYYGYKKKETLLKIMYKYLPELTPVTIIPKVLESALLKYPITNKHKNSFYEIHFLTKELNISKARERYINNIIIYKLDKPNTPLTKIITDIKYQITELIANKKYNNTSVAYSKLIIIKHETSEKSIIDYNLLTEDEKKAYCNLLNFSLSSEKHEKKVTTELFQKQEKKEDSKIIKGIAYKKGNTINYNKPSVYGFDVLKNNKKDCVFVYVKENYLKTNYIKNYTVSHLSTLLHYYFSLKKREVILIIVNNKDYKQIHKLKDKLIENKVTNLIDFEVLINKQEFINFITIMKCYKYFDDIENYNFTDFLNFDTFIKKNNIHNYLKNNNYSYGNTLSYVLTIIDKLKLKTNIYLKYDLVSLYFVFSQYSELFIKELNINLNEKLKLLISSKNIKSDNLTYLKAYLLYKKKSILLKRKADE